MSCRLEACGHRKTEIFSVSWPTSVHRSELIFWREGGWKTSITWSGIWPQKSGLRLSVGPAEWHRTACSPRSPRCKARRVPFARSNRSELPAVRFSSVVRGIKFSGLVFEPTVEVICNARWRDQRWKSVSGFRRKFLDGRINSFLLLLQINVILTVLASSI